MTNGLSNIGRWVIALFTVLLIGTLAINARVKDTSITNDASSMDSIDGVLNTSSVSGSSGPHKDSHHDYTLSDGRGFYINQDYEISFVYQKNWIVTEFNDPRSPGLGLNIRGSRDEEEISIIAIPREDNDLERITKDIPWFEGISPTDESNQIGFGWFVNRPYIETNASPQANIIIPTQKLLYSIVVNGYSGTAETMRMIMDDMKLGGIKGKEAIPRGFIEALIEAFPPGFDSPVTLSTNCSANCLINSIDAYPNDYPCCTYKGNCTWECERYRTTDGGQNFKFRNAMNWNAFRWMTLEADTIDRTGSPRYATGGTIPRVGAVKVIGVDSDSPYGHVATVTAIYSDGRVKVEEQNCNNTCWQEKIYLASQASNFWMRANAGYIYSNGTSPYPTPKDILGNIGNETVIDDFNFGTNIYNFGTFGPGAKIAGVNNGERAWGIEATGLNGCNHFTVSKSSGTENSCVWAYRITAGGVYEVYAWIPNSTRASATSLFYIVGGYRSLPISQLGNRGRYVRLINSARADGNWSFEAGINGQVYTQDTYDGGIGGQFIALDAIRFKRVS